MPASPEFFAVSLLLGLPLTVFLVLWLAGKSVNKMAGWIGALATGGGLAASFLLVDIHTVHSLSFEWLEIGQRPIFLSFRIDNLAFVMLLVVHLVALLVQIYSTAYLHGDENLHRYFAFVQLFLFSMIGIVLSGSLLVMYIFWELVGLSSYLLIGFWYTKRRPVWAAQKAFVLNRIGDAAFLTGILLLFYYIGSTDFEVLVSNVHTISPAMLTLIGICLFGGCVGKSAQFPLSGWLPDAMEGPTPVSALIHAATMVAAGIFLLTRIFFLLTPDAQLFIAVIGTITMLTGAVKATFAWDIKRVLAFSTMSQLGLMVTAVGVGSWQMAFFHLVTHAFFKAGLFLSAGSVIHALHQDGTSDFDPQDMRIMGGLRTSLPVTFICFLICAAALSGLPLFSGFLSKDAIITEGFLSAESIGPVAYVFPVLMMFAAGLTAYYMARQVWLVFFGAKRFSGEEIHPHESPSVMWVPMAILSLLSFFIWFSLSPVSAEGSWFLHLTGGAEAGHLSWVPIAASAISFIAIFMAYRETRTNDPFGMDSLPMREKQRPAFSWFRDFSNEHYFLVPFSSLAGLAGRSELKVVDAFVNFIARANVVTAHLVSWIDRNIVDGTVHLTVYMIRSAGNSVRGLQNGKIQSYFLVTLTGIFLLILWLATL